MKRKVTSKMKRRLCFLACVLLLVIGVFVGTILEDWVQIVDNRNTLASLTVQYKDLLDQEESLNSEVTKLHDIDYVARYAREKYMYSLPNEIIIKIPKSIQ
ncbi:MAG: septum formation initiator family protein [Bacilli bacterium]|jgi:cell division protein DivIC|nr:septum formation initiator family protein [Bacilli bacterium]